MRFIRPRLRKPVGIALSGTAYAAAWLVHGGNGWLWAIVAIFAVTGFGYLLGLSTYGVGEEDPADDANAGHRAPSPAGR